MSFLRRVLSNAIVQMVIEFIAFLAILFPVGSVVLALHLPSTLNNTVAEILGTLVLFGIYFLASRYLERRSLAEMGLPRSHAVRDLLMGFIFGAGLISLVIGILALAGWYHITGIEPTNTLAMTTITGLLIFFGGAFTEEIIFRGVIFRLLERGFGSWIAIGLSSLLFGAAHFATPHASLISVLGIVFTAGLLTSALFMLTRSLWPIIGFHWAWNYFEGPVFGTAVSGTNLPTLLHSTTSGPTLWTGGAFGPEAGLVVFFVGFGVSIPLLILAVRRGCIITPAFLQRTHRPTQPETLSSSV